MNRSRIAQSLTLYAFLYWVLMGCMGVLSAADKTDPSDSKVEFEKNIRQMSREQIHRVAVWLEFVRTDKNSQQIETLLKKYLAVDFQAGQEALQQGITRWSPDIFYVAHDINQDGRQDLVGQINNPFACGAHGFCPTVVLLQKSGNVYEEVFNGIGATRVGVLPGGALVFAGGGYPTSYGIWLLSDNGRYEKLSNY